MVKKGSVIILITIAVVALIGLGFVMYGSQESGPTGAQLINGGGGEDDDDTALKKCPRRNALEIKCNGICRPIPDPEGEALRVGANVNPVTSLCKTEGNEFCPSSATVDVICEGQVTNACDALPGEGGGFIAESRGGSCSEVTRERSSPGNTKCCPAPTATPAPSPKPTTP